MKSFEELTKKQEEIETDPNKIERQDVEAGFQYLQEVYQEELEKKNSEATSKVLESNISHTKRVIENMKRIARSENMNMEKMELAAVLHDIGKVRHDLPAGIDTFGHHETGAKLAEEFLVKKLNKSPELAKSVSKIISRHSDIPFINRIKPDTPKTKTKEDLALRDADVLDMISIFGIRKIIEIRQNPQSKFYQEDKGKLKNAIKSALKSNQESINILNTPEAKKIAEEYKQQTEQLFKKLKEEKAKTLEDFQKVFDEFVGA